MGDDDDTGCRGTMRDEDVTERHDTMGDDTERCDTIRDDDAE